LSIEY